MTTNKIAFILALAASVLSLATKIEKKEIKATSIHILVATDK